VKQTLDDIRPPPPVYINPKITSTILIEKLYHPMHDVVSHLHNLTASEAHSLHHMYDWYIIAKPENIQTYYL